MNFLEWLETYFLEWLKTYWHIAFYVSFLAVYVIFSLAAFYHCREYGYAGDATNFMMVIYTIISLVIIIGTFLLLFSI